MRVRNSSMRRCKASIRSKRLSALAARSASAARLISCETWRLLTCLLTASSLTPYFRAMPRYVLCRVASSSSIAKRCSCEQMVQTLPNYSSLFTPPAPASSVTTAGSGAKLGGFRLPLRLFLRLGFVRGPRQGFPFGVQGFPELVFASLAHFYLQAFPVFHDWAMRLLAGPRAFSDPTYPRSWDFIRPFVLALPSQPLPTRRTFFT